MRKKECPSCAMEVDENEDVCPICGYEFAETKQSKTTYIVIVIFLLALFLWMLTKGFL